VYQSKVVAGKSSLLPWHTHLVFVPCVRGFKSAGGRDILA